MRRSGVSLVSRAEPVRIGRQELLTNSRSVVARALVRRSVPKHGLTELPRVHARGEFAVGLDAKVRHRGAPQRDRDFGRRYRKEVQRARRAHFLKGTAARQLTSWP
jgi:hypothetical protein